MIREGWGEVSGTIFGSGLAAVAVAVAVVVSLGTVVVVSACSERSDPQPTSHAPSSQSVPAVLRPAPVREEPGTDSFAGSALRRQEIAQRFATTAINVGCHGVSDPDAPPVKVEADVSADGEIMAARVVDMGGVSPEVLECARLAARGLESTRLESPTSRPATHRFQRRLRMGRPAEPESEPLPVEFGDADAATGAPSATGPAQEAPP